MSIVVGFRDAESADPVDPIIYDVIGIFTAFNLAGKFLVREFQPHGANLYVTILAHDFCTEIATPYDVTELPYQECGDQAESA